MKHIRNVPWEIGNIAPDFVLGRITCALFLRCPAPHCLLGDPLLTYDLSSSVRYHCLHPEYIHERLKQLGSQYALRVLLLLVDSVSMTVSSDVLLPPLYPDPPSRRPLPERVPEDSSRAVLHCHAG